MEIFRRLGKFKYRIALVILLTFGNALGELFLPRLMSLVVDLGVARGDTAYILRMGQLMLLVVFATVLCRGAAAYHSSKVAMAYSADVRYDLFSKINRLTVNETEYFGISSLITRSTDDVNQVEQMVLMGLRPLVRGPLMFVGGLIMALTTNLKLSLVFPISIPFISLGIYLVIRSAVPYFPILQRRLDRLNQLFRRRLTGIRVTRAFSRDDLEEEIFTEANQDYYEMAIKVNKIIINVIPILGIFLNVALVLVMYFGAQLISLDQLAVGELMAFIQYITQVLMALIMLSFLITMIPRTWASMVRINEVLNYPTHDTGGCQDLKEDLVHIEAKNLTFAYPQAKRPVLQNLSFSLDRGQTLGVIGGTGSGKSTLLRLFLQFYNPTGGQLLLNGKDIQDLNSQDVRRQMSYVPQKNFFFSKTVGENLLYSNQDALEEDLREALGQAQALEFLGQDPLDQEMTRGGTNFSGGQRQRLSIARALNRKAQLYLFDDSFSALDSLTDRKVRQGLLEKTKDAMVIIVAQRVATIRSADKILVLEDGEMVGYGTHQDLLRDNPVYREIALSQGEEAEDEGK